MQLFPLLLAIFSLLVSSTNAHRCRSDPQNHKIIDCSGQTLKEVPQDLDRSTKKLYLCSTTLKNLSSSSFNLYSDLKELYLNNSASLNTVSKDDTFAQLTKLLILSLKNTNFVDLPDFPDSLEKLYLDNSEKIANKFINNSDQINLPSLHTLSLQTNELKTFPKLAHFGPSLVELDLYDNPELTEFKVEDLAPLCQLKTLNVKRIESPRFEMKDEKCQCQAVKAWIRKYGIEATDIECTNENKNCDHIMNDTLSRFESIRSECKSNSKSIDNYWIIVGVIVLLLLCTIVFCYFRRCRKYQRAKLSTLPISENGQ